MHFDLSTFEDLAKRKIVDPWINHMIDPETGRIPTKLDEQWNEKLADRTTPWVVGRQLFSLSAVFVLYGETEYLEKAHRLLGWLERTAWDREYGGWHDLVDGDGTPLGTTKTQFNHLYVETGLAMHYFATRSEAARRLLEQSHEIHRTHWWDPVAGGFVRELSRDLSFFDTNKDFVGQVVPLSGPWLYWYASTGDEALLGRMLNQAAFIDEHLIDPDHGWVLETFNRSWKYLGTARSEYEIDTGHNLERAWIWLRLGWLAGDTTLIELGTASYELARAAAFDRASGMWAYKRPRDPAAPALDTTHWWVQEYGAVVSLLIYHATGDDRYLEVFDRSVEFWTEHFVNEEAGGDYLAVSRAGDSFSRRGRPRSAYHSIEFLMLTKLYYALLVDRTDEALCVAAEQLGRELPARLVEAPTVRTAAGGAGKPHDGIARIILTAR
jgi:mannose/cellobiose epimerase-like protein (N-acyl-D-glucosamine 2-epimerase family)